MNRDELRSGASGGLLAAASTTGALIALGMRTGGASRPFNVIASHLIGSQARDVVGFDPGVTIVGVFVHVVVTALLGVFILGIVRRRLSPLLPATAATSLLCCLASVGVARRGGPSLAQLFPVGDLVVYYVALALSLAAGIRFALPSAAVD